MIGDKLPLAHVPPAELFLLVDVTETAWNLEIEHKLPRDIRSFIG
jgi:hypothetical protein